jgi:hypothetical protein
VSPASTTTSAWDRLRASPIGMALAGAFGALTAIVLAAGVVGFASAFFFASQVHDASSQGSSSRSAIEHLGPILAKYLVLASNWLPLHLRALAGSESLGLGAQVGVVATVMVGIGAVAFALFSAGRLVARLQTSEMTTGGLRKQAAALGVAYGVLLIAFSSSTTGTFTVDLDIIRLRATIGSGLFATLVVGTALGTLFGGLGILSSQPGRVRSVWEAEQRRLGGALEWVNAAAAVLAGWALACAVAVAGIVVAVIVELAIHPKLSSSGTSLSSVGGAALALLYLLNIAAATVVKGTGVALHSSNSGHHTVGLPLVVQLLASVVTAGWFVAAGFLARSKMRNRYTALGFAGRVAVPVMAVTLLTGFEALPRYLFGGKVYGLSFPLFWAMLFSGAEATALSLVGAHLALRHPSLLNERPVLSWFSDGNRADPDGLLRLPGGGRLPWSPRIAVGCGAVFGVAVLAVGSMVALSHRYSAAAATRAYLSAVEHHNVSALATHLQLDSGTEVGGIQTLVTPAGVRATLGATLPPVSGFTIKRTTLAGDTATVQVSISSEGDSKNSSVTLRKVGRRMFFWPGWLVVPTTSELDITRSPLGGALSVDGLPVGTPSGQLTRVRVLAARHRVHMAASAFIAAGNADADTSSGGTQQVRMPISLTPAGTDAVRAAVLGYLRGCAGATTAAPADCPQQVDRFLLNGDAQENLQWSLAGDPTSSLSINVNADGSIEASGYVEMSLTYAAVNNTDPTQPPQQQQQYSSSYSYDVMVQAAGNGFAVVPNRSGD